MKKLITAADIKSILGTGQKVVYVGKDTIITPSARDTAAELGIAIQTGTAPSAPAEVQVSAGTSGPACTGDGCGPGAAPEGISQELITRIVMEVLSGMPGLKPEPALVTEADPSGIRLVRGDSVKCEPFDTGKPNDKVGLKEIFTIRESPDMAAGFMTLEDTAFSWNLTYEEIDYIVEGTLDITINGKTYRGKAGDVFYIPRNTNITFSTPDKAKFFYVAYPANWAEISKQGC
ncbi:MAG: cupin domain-containing protein [Thermincolia bacterium]